MEWLNAYLELTNRMYVEAEYAQDCWVKCVDFFRAIKELHIVVPAAASKKKSTSNYCKPINTVELQICLQMLHYVCKMWTIEKDTEFNTILDNFSNLHTCLPILSSVIRVRQKFASFQYPVA